MLYLYLSDSVFQIIALFFFHSIPSICVLFVGLSLFCCDFSCFRYVHNNIFFSFAIDADLEDLSKKCVSDKLKSGNTDSLSEKASKGGIANGDKCDKSCREEHDNVTELTPDVSFETSSAETEQATYASANNDLKGTKAYQEADVPGLYNLAMAIVDYRGHRVVAQVGLKAYNLSFLSFSEVYIYNFFIYIL